MTAPVAPDPRKLALATVAALVVAGIVLVVAVLPAEYGIDPTGIGRAAGFTRISEDPADTIPNATSADEATLFTFDARWRLVEREIANWTGEVTRSSSQDTIRVPLNVTNLTKLTARLEWIDDASASGPDTLEVSIRGPQGRESDLAQSATGLASASLQWRSTPFPADENGTLSIETIPDESSFGEWRLVVRLYGTGATPEAPDMGNAYTLRLYAESYEHEARAQGGALDKVTLTLAPRGQVEYKFAMEANATMTYRWNATALIHSDLHADHFDDPDDVLEVKIAELQQDAGTYTAAYFGRHGWYFRNDNAFPVTITLETSGDYRILGRV